MTTTTAWPTTADGKYLVLRTVDADWRSRDGFRWRKTVETVAPDWDPDPDRDCGGGLHGLLWGCGDAALLSPDSDAVWLVVAVDVVDVANPDQAHKVRFRAGRVRHHGTRDEAVDYLMAHGAAGLPVVYGRHMVNDRCTATAGYGGTATAGNGGTATAGDDGTATAGNRGTATAGYGGTATAGDYGTATAGDWGTATAGYGGTATAGNGGTATAGNGGTATAGYGGTATAGNGGTATAGYRGTATAGYRGTATAGYGGTLIITWHDGARSRRAVGYIGEGGIKPDTPYRVNGRGEFVEVKS